MKISLLAHNIRSTHNIGSIFRTADGFGVSHIYLSGYSPYPTLAQNETRLPHIHEKLTSQIHKTALGAEKSMPFTFSENPIDIITTAKQKGVFILALEQSNNSIYLDQIGEIFTHNVPPKGILLVLGEEVNGITGNILDLCDKTIEIRMKGQKESFNVSVATGIALYGLTQI